MPKVALDHGPRYATNFGQLTFTRVSQHPASLATVPPLPQGLAVAKLPHARPLSRADAQLVSHSGFTTKALRQSIANLIKMHQFVVGIAHRCVIAPKKTIEQRISGSVLGNQVYNFLFLIDSILL